MSKNTILLKCKDLDVHDVEAAWILIAMFRLSKTPTFQLIEGCTCLYCVNAVREDRDGPEEEPLSQRMGKRKLFGEDFGVNEESNDGFQTDHFGQREGSLSEGTLSDDQSENGQEERVFFDLQPQAENAKRFKFQVDDNARDNVKFE